jgi:hypothetical protein
MQDSTPPKLKRSSGRPNDIEFICLLVAAGIVLTIAALWHGWDIGGAVP